MLWKLALGLVATAALLGVGFYVWMVIAYTPPYVPPSSYQREVFKQGVVGPGQGMQYALWWESADKESPRTYYVDTGPPIDDLSTTTALRVTGVPVPVDVRVIKPGKIEVLFDAPLADKKTRLILETDAEYHVKETIEIRNGEVIRSP